jgi:hypothetical protein
MSKHADQSRTKHTNPEGQSRRPLYVVGGRDCQSPSITFTLPCSLCGLQHDWFEVLDRRTTDDGALLWHVDWHCPSRQPATTWLYVGSDGETRRPTSDRPETGLCPRGNQPLFCATWHDCTATTDRQRRLDQWADRHNKPRETPRTWSPHAEHDHDRDPEEA